MAIGDANGADPSRSSAGNSVVSAPSCTLLVVDDEPDLRELLRVSLSLVGHDVSVAADGHRGLEMTVETKPDAVVLDVMMPGLDGWSVLAALKSDTDPSVSGIPVLMLTARADDLDIVRGGIEGAVRYLTKPFAIKDLRQAVDDALAGAPEPEQRQAAQRKALSQLARLEKGVGIPEAAMARPRMSRMEPVSGGHSPPGHAVGQEWPAWLSSDKLTGRDHEVLHVLVTSANISEARQKLNVSRSYLYARMRHIASKLDFQNGPALVQALRAAKAVRDRDQRRGT